MLRLSFLLSLATVSQGQENLQCSLDGMKAANDMADAGLFIWAADKRCGNPDYADVKCEMDVTNVVTSVNKMVNVMMAALDECGAINEANEGCGIAASSFTAATASLTNAVGGLIDNCPNPFKSTGPNSVPIHDQLTTLGKCVIHAKDSFANFGQVVGKLGSVTTNCADGGNDCTENALNIVSAFTSFGSTLAATVNRCSQYDGTSYGGGCSQHVTALISSLTGLAEAGMEIADKCGAASSRLFEERVAKTKGDKPAASSTMFILAAIIPITAVLSFVGGSRFAKSRARGAASDDEAELLPVFDETEDARAIMM